MATVQTPLQRLPWFVSGLLSGCEPDVEAMVHVTEVVFEPKRFERYRQSHAMSDPIRERPALLATSVADLQPLLEAALPTGSTSHYICVPVNWHWPRITTNGPASSRVVRPKLLALSNR
jgi:hypothetical protein